jgi:pantoate--beta-alanine ligase
MSSRNLRLTDEERKRAHEIYNTLLTIQKNIKAGDVTSQKETARQYLTEKGFRVDYVEISQCQNT